MWKSMIVSLEVPFSISLLASWLIRRHFSIPWAKGHHISDFDMNQKCFGEGGGMGEYARYYVEFLFSLSDYS